jgi:hypothetical protein
MPTVLHLLVLAHIVTLAAGGIELADDDSGVYVTSEDDNPSPHVLMKRNSEQKSPETQQQSMLKPFLDKLKDVSKLRA